MLIILFCLKTLSSKAPKFKVNNRVRITRYKNNFCKHYTFVNITHYNGQKKYLLSIVLETNTWTYKIKNLNG